MEEEEKGVLVLDNSGSDSDLPLTSCVAVIQVQASSEPEFHVACLPCRDVRKTGETKGL